MTEPTREWEKYLENIRGFVHEDDYEALKTSVVSYGEAMREEGRKEIMDEIEKGTIAPPHKVFFQMGRASIKAELLKEVEASRYLLDEDDGVKRRWRYRGYNQALDELTRIIKEK